MKLIVAALLSALCLVFNSLSIAQTTKAIRVVVPYPPGGGNDIIARLLTEDLTRKGPQSFIVDNRPGGSTTIGAELVAKSIPDGNTVLISSHTTFALIPNLRPKLPYDPIKDFEPISLLASQSFALAVHPSMPVYTLKQVIALAKAKPGQLTFSSSGAGTGTHFSGEQLKTLTGIDILHIPYKGGNAPMHAALSGEVAMTFASLSALAPLVSMRKMRIIALTSAKRSKLAPEIPTIAESGVIGYEMTPWYGMVAPKHTSAAIIERLHLIVTSVLKSKETQERLSKIGYEPEGSTPTQLNEHIKLELTRYGKLIKAIGFKDES